MPSTSGTTTTTTSARRRQARYAAASPWAFAEYEQRQQELGERFIEQFREMIDRSTQMMASNYVPRPELEARFQHQDEIIERIGTAIEKLTGSTSNFHENAPRMFADKSEIKSDIAELRTEIEKVKTSLDAFKEQGYGWRLVDQTGRMRGEASLERGWRQQTMTQSSQAMGWIIGGGVMLLVTAINIIIALLMRGL